MKVARVEAERHSPIALPQNGCLFTARPIALESPMIELQLRGHLMRASTMRAGEIPGQGQTNISLRRSQSVPIWCCFDSFALDRHKFVTNVALSCLI